MIDWKEIVLRLALASFFGALVGIERERKDWAAGMRTHMLVCVGSALTMLVSAYGFRDILTTGDHITLDPSRVAAQVISGIGFIGAGTILFLKEGVVKGLTTASGLWTVAAVGLATGGGMYFAALATTLLAIIILWVLQPVERRFFGGSRQKNLRIVAKDQQSSATVIARIFQSSHWKVVSCQLIRSGEEYILAFRFRNVENAALAGLVTDLQSDPAVREVQWDS